jgi:predicted  nucleic acid-binding Zn-ribbon protein
VKSETNPHLSESKRAGAQTQASLLALEAEKAAAERRASAAEREAVALRRRLEQAEAEAEDAVQAALAEAHEAFDTEVDR